MLANELQVGIGVHGPPSDKRAAPDVPPYPSLGLQLREELADNTALHIEPPRQLALRRESLLAAPFRGGHDLEQLATHAVGPRPLNQCGIGQSRSFRFLVYR